MINAQLAYEAEFWGLGEFAPPDVDRQRLAMKAGDLGMTYRAGRLAVTTELVGCAVDSYITGLTCDQAVALWRIFNYPPESIEIQEIKARYAEIDPKVRSVEAQKALGRRQERQDRRIAEKLKAYPQVRGY